MTRFRMLIAVSALATSCTGVVTIQQSVPQGQTAPTPSATLGDPIELSQGIWSIAVDVDVPTQGQQFIHVGDDPETQVASTFLPTYQHAFAAELQHALHTLLLRNANCTISALSVIHAREVWIHGTNGGPMALPSGAIVVLPCGGNEPLVRPDTPAAPVPH